MAEKLKNDQVFQLSLTEIAFTLVFILLMLLGYMVVREQAEKQAAEAALANALKVASSTQSLQSARAELAEALNSAGVSAVNLDETISRLSDTQQLKKEKQELLMRVEDLDAQLTALSELKTVLESAANQDDLLEGEVLSALALQREVRKTLTDTPASPEQKEGAGRRTEKTSSELLGEVREALATTSLLKSKVLEKLGTGITPGKEAQVIEALVDSARLQKEASKNATNIDAARKENADLRGQVAFYQRQLEARGGRDYPPCWATESGSPEFLFSVELTSSGVLTSPAWPTQRATDAQSLPGLEAALQSPQSLESFVRSVQGIFNASKAADPQCRHYVLLKSSIADASTSDRARLTVERYFYKRELPR